MVVRGLLPKDPPQILEVKGVRPTLLGSIPYAKIDITKDRYTVSFHLQGSPE